MKIIINKCYGGFGLSNTACEDLNISSHYEFKPLHGHTIRTDPRVIKAVEDLGTEVASASFAKLKIIEIPNDVEYTIEEYDGIEWIAEVHRTWE